MLIKPIRTDASNAFAHASMARRLPKSLREVQTANKFPASIQARLDDLYEQLSSNALIPLPNFTAPDADTWLEAYQAHEGETWQAAEWFFAETYFFHQINDLVQYWQNGQDPYRPMKKAELESEGISLQVEAAESIEGTPAERLAILLEMALWGNRVDLSLPEVMAQGQKAALGDLLVDERAFAVERLLKSEGKVHLITDNFGTELAMDLALVDALLNLSIPVMLHVKMYPTYISDATAFDVCWMLETFAKRNYPFAHRLQQALETGQLQVAPDFFWNSPYFLNQLPPRLMKIFAEARLLILKGDANYRRAFFDTLWPIETPAKQIVDYLPAPLLCLRTLKSDCVAGLSLEAASQAAAYSPDWRILGKYGLIQYIPSAAGESVNT